MNETTDDHSKKYGLSSEDMASDFAIIREGIEPIN